MNEQVIKKYISVIRRACDLLEQQLDEKVSEAFAELESQVVPQTVSQVATQTAPQTVVPPLNVVVENPDPPYVPDPQQAHARKIHLDALMGIDCWPPAIPQFQADAKPTQLDMIHRANAVLDMSLGTSVEGAHFLDYGCGDGYIASQMENRGVASITGYDLVPSDHWDKLATEKVNYTCDVNSLPAQGFDLVFLYDVLDHSVDPVGIMSHIKHLAVPGAIIYVRCHPWTSKHASHLPKFGLNKSYIHLFIKFQELFEMGFKPLFTREEKNPLEAYRWWFHEYKIIKEKPIYEDVSEFFLVDSFKDLLSNEQNIPVENIDEFINLMRLQFVDYVLEVPK